MSFSSFSFSALLCLRLPDVYHAAVDVVRTRQTPQPPGGAEGRGGRSSDRQSRRHDGDAEEDPAGERSFEGNFKVEKK